MYTEPDFNCKDNKLYSDETVVLKKKIENRLSKDYSLILYDCVDSTNLVLKQMAEQGANKNTVVISNKQTNGRGRLGRSFFSPAHTGVYMSILLRPDMLPSESVKITACAGVAVCRALEKTYNIKPKIKWVNDIFVNDKKVCGILAESSIDAANNTLKYVVLGIGINLCRPDGDFPPEIAQIADSVLDCEKINTHDKAVLISQILLEFSQLFDNIDSSDILVEYKNRMFLMGKTVIVNAAEPFEALITDINEDFSLKLKLSDERVMNLSTGEIGIKPLIKQ